MAEDIDEVASVLAAAVGGMNFTYQGDAVPVFQRKKAMQRDKTEPAVMLSVSPMLRAHQSRRFDSENDLHTYRCAVVFYAPGNRDNVSGAPEAADIEEAMRKRLNATPLALDGVTGIMDVRAEDGRFLDRQALKLDRDAVMIEVVVDAVKTRYLS